MTPIEFLKTQTLPERKDFLGGLFYANGKVCASDRHVLFMIDKPIDFTDEIPEQTQKVNSIYNPPKDGFIKYSIAEIREAYKEIPLVDEYEYEDCDDCLGCGTVDYKFRSNSGETYTTSKYCPVCQGEGHFGKKTGRLVHDSDEFNVVIQDCFFNSRLFIDVINAPGCADEIYLMAKDNRVYFRSGVYEGILMGLVNNDKKTITLNPTK